MKNPKITVLVFSYNRPRMLAEALASIKDADEVIILDDGSDFDVAALAKAFNFKSFSLFGLSKLSIEERLKTQRLPYLANKGLKLAKGDIIVYLCDDDLMDKNWLTFLKNFYSKHGEKYHFVRGHCVRFEDNGEGTFEEKTKHLLVFADSPRQLITGNFAHLKKCFSEEKIKWKEGPLWGHDSAFLDNVDVVHDTWTIPVLPMIACYRRIHDKMLTNHCFSYGGENGENEMDIFGWSESGKKMLRENKFLE